MAAESERYWPSLRDLLRPEEHRRRLGLSDDGFVSAAQLRWLVRRDLEDLFNATNLAAREDLSRRNFPRIRASVLNYGVPDLAGRYVRGLPAMRLKEEIEDAIRAFEPRIRPETVAVRITSLDDDGAVALDRPLRFEISGEVYADPVPEMIFASVTLDKELGAAAVEVS